jgi:HD-like signal output (HDOD) protein
MNMNTQFVKSLSEAEMEKTLKGISIPPRPQVLVKLGKEMSKDDPDPQVIVRLISADVGLSAAVLKTVNSPFFGLASKISSVGNAVSLMGMRTAGQIVTGLVLRNAVAGDNRSLERFWDSAEKVAGIAAYVASTLPRGPRDDAYSFGLFRDIGIPILMQKFPDYRQTLAAAEVDREHPMTWVEDERHATNHATLGYLIGKGWFLPATLCEAILYHHDPLVFDDAETISPQALTLVAIAHLAEHFNDEYVRMRTNPEWDRMGARVLNHLGLSDTEYLDLREELATMIR